MAKQTRTILKGYFETGDVPNQNQYADFIDSKVNMSESNTGDINLIGNITASGISASGAIVAATLDTGQGANELYDMNQNVLTTSAVTFTTVDTGQGANELYDMNQNVLTTSNVLFADITASGHVSGSDTSTGSFGTMILSSLPTVEPLVSGALWLSGSGAGAASGSKYLMVFNG